MARKIRDHDSESSPAEALEKLAKDSVALAKKAKRNKKSLTGDNFYGNKLVELRADATNAFQHLTSNSPGDTTALAELIEGVFSATTQPRPRATAQRELSFALKTTWKKSSPSQQKAEPDLFPLSILAQAKRGYLLSVGHQRLTKEMIGICFPLRLHQVDNLFDIGIIDIAFDHSRHLFLVQHRRIR